ncbi:hypothetical protein ABW20_dc0110327 [Dactylellina cionopaga]|nr:hypothetical protein ABW20_dc0110327 [Dactylellina cionopaga]
MSHHPHKRSRAAFEKEDVSAYIVYGTPFEKPDPKSREQDASLPVWKQEVVDERGRKRLHGAFTGGFSAGYFNTVGTKEGWTPSTFTSSRSNRAKVTALKPEDFMDDEDRADAEAEEERRLQREAEEAAAAGASSTADELANRGLTNTATLFQMLSAPDKEEYPLGRKLMLKMGWREGTGAGPKVRRKVRDQEHEGGEGAQDDDFRTYLFAPDDVIIPEKPHKMDQKGLGYTGELKAEEEEGEEAREDARKTIKPTKKPNVRLGMGVGILNDDGEDDEDIYEIKPKSAYSKVLGGEKKKKGKTATTATAGGGGIAMPKPAIKVPGRHVFVSKKDSVNRPKIRKCRDGTLPLPGFILSEEPFWDQSAKQFPLPEVPEDWVPQRLLANPEKYAAAVAAKETKAVELDIKARGLLLGEEQMPSKSVFDFLTPAARERIAAASGKKNLPKAKGEQVDTGKDAMQKSQDAIPYLEKSVAENALKGFLPYADAPQKKVRYRTFLEIKAEIRQGMPIREKGVSLEDWAKELHEFANAARIFKPVTGLMANRFTSSSAVASQLPTTGGTKNLETNEETLISRPVLKADDPALAAAKMGMYGAMTRSVVRFYPTRLLCKRFNVQPPVHVDPMGDEEAGVGRDVELVNKREMDRMMIEANTNPEWGVTAGKSVGSEKEGGNTGEGEPMELDENEEEAEEVDINFNPALEAERAGDEVFKAIFGDDSDDDEEE